MIIALLLQQKKEKEKQIQQTRKQFDSAIKANTEKIMQSSRKEFESLINTRQQELEQIKNIINGEFDKLESRRIQMEQDLSHFVSKIQQLQQRCVDLSNCDMVVKSAANKYDLEVRKMSEQLVADYQRRVKSIKKKTGQKKYSEIKVFL